MSQPEVLTPAEVAQELGFCLRTVQRMIRRGEIPATKLGSRWFIDAKALAERLTVR